MRILITILLLIIPTLVVAGQRVDGNLVIVDGGLGIGASGSAYVTTPQTTNFILSGNLGIGSTNPGSKLDLGSGGIRAVGIGTTVPQQLCRKANGQFGYFNGTWASVCN